MGYQLQIDIDFKRNTYPGKFIVIEGIDGSGKTTQAERLVQKLREKNVKAIYTKEPTDEPTGQFIRSEVLSGKTKIPNVAIQYLMAADRAVHHEKVEEYLKQGYTVVSDRYFWSAVAYGLGDKYSNEMLKQVQHDKLEVRDDNSGGQLLLAALSILSMYHQFIAPDSTLYLSVSIDTAIERIKRKKTHIEIYEKKEKLDKIAKGYKWITHQFSNEITVIDGERGVEEVTKDILNIIQNL